MGEPTTICDRMRTHPLAVLILCHPERRPAVATLAASLDLGFEVEVSSDRERLRALDREDAIFIDSSDGPLSDDQSAALLAFVTGGGGVVAAGETLSIWRDSPTMNELAGFSPNGRTIETELLISDADGTTLVGAPLPVRGTVHLLANAPPGAEPLLLTSWRYERQVVAYAKDVGDGQFAFLGLHERAEPYRDARVRGLVRASVVHVSRAMREQGVAGVALLGFGALGRTHAEAIQATGGLELRCVCDTSAERRAAAAQLDVDTVATAAEMLARNDVDVVVIGTPPVHHAEETLAAIDAGKHVVCEKPFALTAADCDRVMSRARDMDRVVTVYQNRRWDPDFVAVREAVDAGAIGSLFSLESFVGGFGHPCHYWHSHEPISGGAIFDWGSHYIDWILELFHERVVALTCVSHKRLWHDVTNADHVSLDMRFASGTQATFIHSHVAAALKPKWYILGTAGAIVADWQHTTTRLVGPDGEVDEEPVAPTDLPARVRIVRPGPDGGSSEQTLALPRRDRLAFYRNLASHLRTGEPLAVAPEQARRTVAVMEAAAASAAGGGRLVDTDI